MQVTKGAILAIIFYLGSICGCSCLAQKAKHGAWIEDESCVGKALDNGDTSYFLLQRKDGEWTLFRDSLLSIPYQNFALHKKQFVGERVTFYANGMIKQKEFFEMDSAGMSWLHTDSSYSELGILVKVGSRTAVNNQITEKWFSHNNITSIRHETNLGSIKIDYSIFDTCKVVELIELDDTQIWLKKGLPVKICRKRWHIIQESGVDRVLMRNFLGWDCEELN